VAAGGGSGDDDLVWPEVTESPRRPGRHSPVEQALVDVCGGGDRSLDRVASRAARRAAAGAAPLEGPELTFALRAEGQPHMAPKTWAARAAHLDASDAADRFGRAIGAEARRDTLRCGAASFELPDGTSVVAGVAAFAIADLSPLPTLARTGQWIRFDARLSGAASYAKVIALGPLGPPRTVPTSLSAGGARAVLSVDRPGQWIVQLVTSGAHGTRPVLEAMIFVDESPPRTFEMARAPGEEIAAASGNAEEDLLSMVNVARATEGARAVARSTELDALARAHAEAMRAAGIVSHDVGSGDPVERVGSAGLSIETVGENVARAEGIQRAHRALWWSPSHRANLLDRRFDGIGLGVARDGKNVWVCELFADFGVAGIGLQVD
jgi:uncharacterized protein YkwD